MYPWGGEFVSSIFQKVSLCHEASMQQHFGTHQHDVMQLSNILMMETAFFLEARLWKCSPRLSSVVVGLQGV